MLEAFGLALQVEADTDDVEAEVRVATLASTGHPGFSQASQSGLFGRSDGQDGPLRSRSNPVFPSGLDFDEHHGVRVEGDKVELTLADSPVPVQDLPAPLPELMAGDLLGEPAELPSTAIALGL